MIRWIVFAVAAHICAAILGGRGTLSKTLGATSLVAAPQILGAVHVLPGVSTIGLGFWSLICGYVAIKEVHGLSSGRAFWATLLPVLVIAVLLALMVAAGIGTFLALGAASGWEVSP